MKELIWLGSTLDDLRIFPGEVQKWVFFLRVDICEFRAQYGSYLLKELSGRLTKKYGKGFGISTLNHTLGCLFFVLILHI